MRGPSVSEQSDCGRSVNEMFVDYSEYEWMGGEDLEKFDQQMLEEMLEEDQFYENCIDELEEHLEEELGEDVLEEDVGYLVFELDSTSIRDNRDLVGYLAAQNSGVGFFYSEESVLENSKLNPDAPEFVPRAFGDSAIEKPEEDEPNH